MLPTRSLSTRFLVCSTALILSALSSPHAAPQSPTYTVQDIGGFGGFHTFVSGFNDNGQVVGASQLPDFSQHAFVWSESGGMSDLGTFDGANSGASDINNNGVVVGAAETASGVQHAFIWTAAGGMIDITPDETVDASANALNDSGQVVGYRTVGGVTRAFSWTTSGGLVDPTPDCPADHSSSALAVNAAGQVLSQCTPFGRVFLWSAADGPTEIGNVGSDVPSTFVNTSKSLNDSGQVVGWLTSSTMSSGTHVFVWSATGGLQFLEMVSGFRMDPTAISADGEVVGTMDSDTDRRVFTWTAAGGLVDLGPGTAGGIRAGYVVGTSTAGAAIWTPTGELTNLDVPPGLRNGFASWIDASGRIFGQTARPFRGVMWKLASAPPPSAPTPTGTNVSISPPDDTTGTTPVTMTFANVTTAGDTMLTTPASPPAIPSGFAVGDPPVFYDITTTAQYSGAISVCINFGNSFLSGSDIRLLHFENGAWLDVTTSGASGNVICGTVTSLSPFAVVRRLGTTMSATGPATIWLGLKNSDDVGTKFDVLAEVLKNGAVVGTGQANSLAAGSSGFNSAVQQAIGTALGSSTTFNTGDTLAIRLSVRIAATGHRNGTARLWYNDSAANTRLNVTLNGVPTTLWLTSGSRLSSSVGAGPKATVDVFADRAVGGNPFKSFGSWTKAF